MKLVSKVSYRLTGHSAPYDCILHLDLINNLLSQQRYMTGTMIKCLKWCSSSTTASIINGVTLGQHEISCKTIWNAELDTGMQLSNV